MSLHTISKAVREFGTPIVNFTLGKQPNIAEGKNSRDWSLAWFTVQVVSSSFKMGAFQHRLIIKGNC